MHLVSKKVESMERIFTSLMPLLYNGINFPDKLIKLLLITQEILGSLERTSKS
jgi:hypothetical protein